MKKLGVELLLVAVCATFALTLTISYVVYVHQGGGSLFPFISTLGEYPPASCIFSFGLNLGAIISLSIIAIRYKHIHFLYTDSAARVGCLNKFSVGVGILSFSGAIVVASFQYKVVPSVHGIGAAMTFVFGILYLWLQTHMSFRIFHSQLSNRVGRVTLVLRVLLSLSATVFLCVGVINVCIRFFNSCSHVDCPVHYYISTSCEWLLTISLILYFLTFHWEFMEVSLSVKIKTRSNHSNTIMSYIDEDTPLTL